MSRCFPYPPPGYIGKRASEEALIESIKLQKERELAKAEKKKEKKREKREKKISEKGKEKQTSTVGHDEKAKHTSVAQKGLKSWIDSEEGYEKRRENSAEQLERSDLTEEQGQPASSTKPCYSSDSTQNSNKRRRPASPPPSGTIGHGNIIRIRLPSQKHKEPDSGKEFQCSTSGRTDPPPPPVTDLPGQSSVANLPFPSITNLRVPSVTNLCVPSVTDNVEGLRLEDNKKLTCSTSEPSEIFALSDTNIASSSIPSDKKKRRLNKKYENLFPSWVASAFRSDFDDDQEDWLFSRKHNGDGQEEKRCMASGDLSCGDSLLPPVRYLPEADVYALPYTVPF